MGSFDFRKALKLQQQMSSMQKEFDPFIKGFLLRQALDALEKTKENTPAHLEELRAAWTIDDVEDTAKGIDFASFESVRRTKGGLAVTIHNPVAYASSVEYGAMAEDHTHWIKGKFMCVLAMDEIARQMPKQFQAVFEKWARGLSKL